MSPSGEGPSGQQNPVPGQGDDGAYIGDGAGQLDGEIIDDLDGNAMGEASDDSDGAEDDDGGGGGLSDDLGVDGGDATLEDDSIHVFEGHRDAVLAVAWSSAVPDLVATGGQDDCAFLWRVGQDALEQTGGSLHTYELQGHTDSVASVAFSSSGRLLATGGMDGMVKIWDPSTGQLGHTLDGPGGSIEWMQWHPKGDVVLAGSEDLTVWMWNAQTGVCMQVFAGHSGSVTAGTFAPDGRTIVTAGGDDDCTLRAWNPKTGECTATIQGHPFHTEGITALAMHTDCATVMTGSQDGSCLLTNVQSKRVMGSLHGDDLNAHEQSVEAVGFSQQQPLAASAGMDGRLLVWDLSTLSQRGLCQHPQGVTRLAWHPLQPLVFTGAMDGVARCWDLRTAACVREYHGHSDAVQDLCLSPDGNFLLTGSDDHTARVFQTQLG